jgi:hypothetical protein
MEKTLSEPKTDFGVKDVEAVDAGAQPTSIRRGEVGHDILTLQNVDPALDAKMHLVNNVRMTPKSAIFQPQSNASFSAYQSA